MTVSNRISSLPCQTSARKRRAPHEFRSVNVKPSVRLLPIWRNEFYFLAAAIAF
jgi:hypothetical protein